MKELLVLLVVCGIAFFGYRFFQRAQAIAESQLRRRATREAPPDGRVEEMVECANCGTYHAGAHCSNCGHPSRPAGA